MRYIALYLIAIAVIAFGVSSVAGALANDALDGCIGAGTISHPCP